MKSIVFGSLMLALAVTSLASSGCCCCIPLETTPPPVGVDQMDIVTGEPDFMTTPVAPAPLAPTPDPIAPEPEFTSPAIGD